LAGIVPAILLLLLIGLVLLAICTIYCSLASTSNTKAGATGSSYI